MTGVAVPAVGEILTGVAVMTAIVWLPLFPALVWGKSAIPRSDVGRLLARAGKFTVGVGLPVMLALLIAFSRMADAPPPLGELLARCGGAAIGFLPLYGALIFTSVFQERHRADRAAGIGRPFPVRLFSGLAILLANGFAWLVMMFTLFAVTGVYRGWN